MPQPLAPSRRRLQIVEGQDGRKREQDAPPFPAFDEESGEVEQWRIPGAIQEIEEAALREEPSEFGQEHGTGEKIPVAPNLAYLVREFGGESGTLTPLEELARRLETARIPVVEEAERREVFEPRFVSDTLANILVSQGAYSEAIKAFQTLARMKPDRAEYYQEKIQEMKVLLQGGDTTSKSD